MPPSPGDVLLYALTMEHSYLFFSEPSLHISMYVHPMQLNTSWIMGWEVQAGGRHSCCCPLREGTPWGDPCERGRPAQLSHFIQRPHGSLPGSGQGLHQVKEQRRKGQGYGTEKKSKTGFWKGGRLAVVIFYLFFFFFLDYFSAVVRVMQITDNCCAVRKISSTAVRRSNPQKG